MQKKGNGFNGNGKCGKNGPKYDRPAQDVNEAINRLVNFLKINGKITKLQLETEGKVPAFLVDEAIDIARSELGIYFDGEEYHATDRTESIFDDMSPLEQEPGNEEVKGIEPKGRRELEEMSDEELNQRHNELISRFGKLGEGDEDEKEKERIGGELDNIDGILNGRETSREHRPEEREEQLFGACGSQSDIRAVPSYEEGEGEEETRFTLKDDYGWGETLENASKARKMWNVLKWAAGAPFAFAFGHQWLTSIKLLPEKQVGGLTELWNTVYAAVGGFFTASADTVQFAVKVAQGLTQPNWENAIHFGLIGAVVASVWNLARFVRKNLEPVWEEEIMFKELRKDRGKAEKDYKLAREVADEMTQKGRMLDLQLEGAQKELAGIKLEIAYLDKDIGKKRGELEAIETEIRNRREQNNALDEEINRKWGEVRGEGNEGGEQ